MFCAGLQLKSRPEAELLYKDWSEGEEEAGIT